MKALARKKRREEKRRDFVPKTIVARRLAPVVNFRKPKVRAHPIRFLKSKSKEEVKLSPFDKAVENLKTKNNLTAATLAPALKIDKVNVITDITKKDVGVKLLDTDIEKIKAVLIKDGVIKEKSSQKILLGQLTLLSR